jgi:hypothetical protein
MERHAMAATTDVDVEEQAVADLRTVELMVEDLASVAGEWDQLSPDERMSWSLDWSNEMAALERISRAAAAGQLPSAAPARFRRLVRKIGTALPLLDRLHLYRPAVPLDR